MVKRRGMIHLNGNLLCSVAGKVTGRTPFYHDLIQVCVIVLDEWLNLDKAYTPFYCDIKPRRPENIDHELLKQWIREPHVNVEVDALKLTKKQVLDISNKGLHCFKAADLFERWFDRLQLRPGKRISPLAQNWRFLSPYIMDWLGGEYNMYHFFDGRYRDTLSAASFLNDYADWHRSTYPFPKMNLRYLSTQIGMDTQRGTDLLGDCLAIAEVYKTMLRDPIIALSPTRDDEESESEVNGHYIDEVESYINEPTINGDEQS